MFYRSLIDQTSIKIKEKNYNYIVTKETVRKLELLIDDFIQEINNKYNYFLGETTNGKR